MPPLKSTALGVRLLYLRLEPGLAVVIFGFRFDEYQVLLECLRDVWYPTRHIKKADFSHKRSYGRCK